MAFARFEKPFDPDPVITDLVPARASPSCRSRAAADSDLTSILFVLWLPVGWAPLPGYFFLKLRQPGVGVGVTVIPGFEQKVAPLFREIDRDVELAYLRALLFPG
jgi:hypothetical protein